MRLELLQVLSQCDFIDPLVGDAAKLIIDSIENGGKVLICGNGGSAADAQHFAAELSVRFEKERRPLPAIALGMDHAYMTAVSNDYGFSFCFSKRVEALGKAEDILVAISTSGTSGNVRIAAEQAKKKGMKVLSLTGNARGVNLATTTALTEFSDLEIRIPSTSTARIQEVHTLIIHGICGKVDDHFTRTS